MNEIDRDWDRLIGERVRLRELRILHAVIRHGSMAKAAAALSMTQPAVSQAIALLEAGLGVPLMERSPAGVTPTEFGEAILRSALGAMDTLAEGVREVAMLADPGQGEIVVGASESYIAGGGLARTIQALGQRYPRIRINVVESNTAAMDFADLRTRRVDVMLGRAAIVDLPEDIHVEVLRDESLFVTTSGRNTAAWPPGVRIADLADKKWVLAPPGTAVHEVIAAAFRAEDAAMPAVTITTWSMVLRLQLLEAGDYFTAFPDSLVRENTVRWNLRVVPVALGRPLPVGAFRLRSREKNRAIQVFIATAKGVESG